MKKQLSTISLSLALMSSFMGYSQNEQKIQPCDTYKMMEERFAKDPEARKSYEASQEKFQNELLANQNNAAKTAAVVYTVPVVFHILHQGGPENIADAICINALNWINGDYARTHSDTNQVVAPFKASYIPSDIHMMLAKKDPNGNCTSGILHHFDSKTIWNQGSAGSNGYWTYTWDPTKYLNVYIVAQIVPQGTVTGGGIIVGYTYRPGTWPTGNTHDAIVYNYQFLGQNQQTDIRSLSHEMGHWFNLAHTFGNTNNPGVTCGDDGIADTPVTKGEFSSCPASSTNSAIVCAMNQTPYFENVQNIMNYSSCPKNFTTGQTNAMRTALASATSGRSNVISAGNLVATDVNGTTSCAPIAEFLSTTNGYTVCSGGSLNMKDFSYNGVITSWAWSGDNGAVFGAPAASLTSVMFPSVGVSVITLTVSNGQGSSTQTRTVTILNGAQGVPNNYFESFEAAGTPANWSIINPDNGTTWEQTTFGASDGSSSFFIEGNNDPSLQYDYLVMPIIDPLDNPNDTIFTFKFAYQRANATNNDRFEVQASSDCGGTWQTIVGLSASQMANFSAGTNAAPYFPAAADWHKVDIYNNPYWTNYLSFPSVTIRFMFQESTSGNGNRFFLDEINYTSVYDVGINELTKNIHFNLYPNPTSSETFIKFNLNDASNVKIRVTDIVGKDVLSAIDSNYSPGEQSISINKNNSLSKGVYFINLSVNGAKMCKKLIIQ